jgi:hypothetical protein
VAYHPVGAHQPSDADDALAAGDLRCVHHAHVPAEDQRPHDTVDLITVRWQVVEPHPHPLGWSTVADLIYTTNVSLDGFIEDDRGRFDFTDPDDDVIAFIAGLERSAGTYL